MNFQSAVANFHHNLSSYTTIHSGLDMQPCKQYLLQGNIAQKNVYALNDFNKILLQWHSMIVDI